MASLDQLKQTFFEECSEALEQIESGLTDLREGNAVQHRYGGEEETVTANRQFRFSDSLAID